MTRDEILKQIRETPNIFHRPAPNEIVRKAEPVALPLKKPKRVFWRIWLLRLASFLVRWAS